MIDIQKADPGARRNGLRPHVSVGAAIMAAADGCARQSLAARTACPAQNRSRRERGVRLASWISSIAAAAEAEKVATQPVLRRTCGSAVPGQVRLKPDTTERSHVSVGRGNRTCAHGNHWQRGTACPAQNRSRRARRELASWISSIAAAAEAQNIATKPVCGGHAVPRCPGRSGFR